MLIIKILLALGVYILIGYLYNRFNHTDKEKNYEECPYD